MNRRASARSALVLLLLATLALRGIYMARATSIGDESVFGLMALAIGRGEEFPLYCWGAHYASALVSYIAVPLIALLGLSTFALKSAVLPWNLALVMLAFLFLRRRFDPLLGLLAAAAIAAPPATVLVYSSIAHGGYPETYFLGFAIWMIALNLSEDARDGAETSLPPRALRFALLGFLMGASFSILWLGLPFILSALFLLQRKGRLRKENLPIFGAGALIGLLPFLWYNIVIAPGATILRLGARSLETGSPSQLPVALLDRARDFPNWVVETGQGLGLLFGYESPIPGWTLAIPFIALFFWGLARLRKSHPDWFLLIASFLLFHFAFNLAGNLTRNRMLSPLYFALLVTLLALPRRAAFAALLLLIATNLVGIQRLIEITHPDPDILAAAAFIRSEKPDAFICDYDAGYPAAFLSGGKIPVSAVAPPNPSDRRPNWTERVKSAKRPMVMLGKESSREFEQRLLEMGVLPSLLKRRETPGRFLYLLDARGDSVLAAVRALR